ncbi:chemotaxis protein CheW [Desulfococcaceae bacterium HSG8]|nr:chemotaxis protein CheW [Desulfococcaceae bacterium HSG8]
MESEKLRIGEKRQFCSFYVADHLFGVDILDVKEIKDEVSLTIVYHAPREVRGFVNIRGHVYLVLDLRLILGFDSREVDDISRVVLFKQKVGESFGVLVDRIGDMVEVDESQIEARRPDENTSPSGMEQRKSDLSMGICKLKNELLIILDAAKFLDTL